MTNNEKFNAMINACDDPRRMLNALIALAPLLRASRPQSEREALLASLEEGGEEACSGSR